jgi:hypothetical protein
MPRTNAKYTSMMIQSMALSMSAASSGSLDTIAS